MSTFLHNTEGSYTPAKVWFTLFMVIVAHTVGSLPLFFALPDHINPSDTHQVALALGSTRFFLLQMIPFALVAVVLIALQRWVHKRTMVQLFTGRSKVSVRRFFYSFFLWGSIMVLTTLIQIGLNTEELVWNFNAIPFFKTMLLLILFIPVQVLAEELLFRGFILQRLNGLIPSSLFSMLLSGVLFGLLHASNPEVMTHGYGLLFVYIGFGVFLSFLTVVDNGLELAYGFHVANNFFQGILITSSDQAFQLNGLFKSNGVSLSFTSILLLLGSLTVYLALCFRAYPWSIKAVFKNNE
ncbi:MAG: lysostaphin resistance A-like protein [Flavobacteriales bacterium]|jgi:membrane protease YdiL (CAAX protease family)